MPHTKTRRRQARGCSRQRSSHPLRRRVGTQPAATHPLLDRELSCSLRGDLSESRMPAWETLQCPVSVSRGTAAGWTQQAVCVCSRKGSLNVCGGLERGGWAREIQQQAHAMDPSMRCLAWPGSANGATHASPGQRPGSLKGRNKPWFVRTFRTGVAPSGLVGLGRGKTRGVAPGCLEAAPLGRPASGSLAKTASRSATPWVGKRGMPHTRTRRHEEDMRLGAQAGVHAHSWSWGWARHCPPPREGTRPTAWGLCGRAVSALAWS